MALEGACRLLDCKTHHSLGAHAEYLGTTTILASTPIPNPLPAGTTSVTKPGLNLATGTSYLNITVACWPANFSSLVRLNQATHPSL